MLKVAAAGGIFAAPIIASFSMDATAAQASPGSPIVSNMVVSNMFCSNQNTFVPTGFFSAQVAGSGPIFPVFGLVLLEILGGPHAELAYQISVPGFIRSLSLDGPGGGITIHDPGRHGVVPAAFVTCGNHLHLADAGLAALFDMLASGEATAFVDLEGGVDLSGPVSFLPAG